MVYEKLGNLFFTLSDKHKAVLKNFLDTALKVSREGRAEHLYICKKHFQNCSLINFN